MGHRGPLYMEIADIVVSTDGRKVAAVADDIMRRFQEPPS
jgi:shikimate kinase